MILYATAGDVAAAPGGNVDDDTPAMIEIASEMVTFATRNDYYATDSESMPRVDYVLDAFKRATIAQVIGWQVTGVTLADLYGSAASVSVTPNKSNIGSGGIERDAAAISSRDTARVGSTQRLFPRAYKILRNINFCSAAVGLW